MGADVRYQPFFMLKLTNHSRRRTGLPSVPIIDVSQTEGFTLIQVCHKLPYRLIPYALTASFNTRRNCPDPHREVGNKRAIASSIRLCFKVLIDSLISSPRS